MADEYLYMMISYWGKEPKFSQITEAEYQYWMSTPWPAGYSVKKILAPNKTESEPNFSGLKGE